MISVILVNYNGAGDTIECISSICNSIEKDYRVIVVDNCSTDDSVKKLKDNQNKYKFELLVAEKNLGFSNGNNIGIKRALELGTDYIWLLNNDTLIEPNTMTELLKCFAASIHCGVAIGKILYESCREKIWYAGGSFNQVNARTEHWHYNEISGINDNKLQRVTFATGCCVFMSITAFQKVGYMDEDYFLYEEDADYSIKIIRSGYEIIYNPQAIVYHKVSSSTGSSSPLSQYYSIRNKFLLIRKNLRGINRIKAYAYCSVQFLYRCIKGEIAFKYYYKGIKAHINHEIGKREAKI